MKLYEIPAKYQEIYDAAGDGEVTEETVAALERLKEVEAEKCEKYDAYAIMYKSKMAAAMAIKAEIDALDKRLKANKAAADWLKQELARVMQEVGDTAHESPRCKISFRRSEAVEIVNEDKIPPAYITYTPKINIADIKAELRRGYKLPGCRLVSRANIQIK